MPRPWQARRRSEGLLAMTLAEVLVLLFFVLALALAVTHGDLRKYAVMPPAGVAAIRAAVDRGTLPEDWTVLVAAMEGDSSIRADLGPLTGGQPWSKTVPTSELADSVVERWERISRELVEAAVQQGLDPGAVESTSIEGVVVFLSRGRDYPPCWKEPAEDYRFDIVYALEVVLRADEIDVRGIWPESYQVRAEQVNNLVNLADAGTISYADFGREALPVFEWSQLQPTQCRHFVVIHDSVQSADAKEDFKHGLLTVEDFFYKYLVR